MNEHLFIHPRIHERHPEIDESDVSTAWNGALISARRLDRDQDEWIAVGLDSNGRVLEMVAVRNSEGQWLIYHAMTPPSKETLHELNIITKEN